MTGELEPTVSAVEAMEQLTEKNEKEAILKQNFKLRDMVTKAEKGQKAAKQIASELELETQELATELDLYQHSFKDRPRWMKRRPPQRGHIGSPVAFLSDTHFGEIVKPGEIKIGGYNAYNMKIAELRTHAFFEKTIMLCRDFMSGVQYDGIVLALGGDLVSGDIHEELVETNEQSTLRTVETIVPWLLAGVEMLAENFGKVHVVSAPGNHGRNSKKPRAKKRSENNADTHIAKLMAMFHQNEEAITYDIPEGSDVDFELYTTRFAMEHGDDLRFNGTSEIGSLGPVKRGTLRASRQRQVLGRPFDVFLVGHFHQYVPADTQGFVMNGSLKGYDEYAHRGKFVPEPARQALMLVTPEHGITMNTPVIVTNRSKEGW